MQRENSAAVLELGEDKGSSVRSNPMHANPRLWATRDLPNAGEKVNSEFTRAK